MTHLRHLAAPTYLATAALAVIPPCDALMQMLPFRVAEARWRFGAFGILGHSMTLALTGLVLMLVAATLFDHRRVRRAIGVAAVLALITTAAAWIVFALDVLQVRREIQPGAALAFKVASATAALKAALAMVILASIAVAALRRRRSHDAPRSLTSTVFVGAHEPPTEAKANQPV